MVPSPDFSSTVSTPRRTGSSIWPRCAISPREHCISSSSRRSPGPRCASTSPTSSRWVPDGLATSSIKTSPATTATESASWATPTSPAPSRKRSGPEMIITRLYVRNYRVFEDELDLALPAGLVGIYGPNGAGKSVLVESIRWTLFGKARTANDEIRTSGVGDDCITEVEFEHEGHLYLVRRTISGVNHTVKAAAFWNGQQVADGVRDVTNYV